MESSEKWIPVAATSRLTASAAAPAATSDNDNAQRSIGRFSTTPCSTERLSCCRSRRASVAIIPLQIKMVR